MSKLHRDHLVLVVLVVRSEVRKHGHYIIETKVEWVTFSFHSSGIIFLKIVTCKCHVMKENTIVKNVGFFREVT